jgi:hypothetical protein
VSAPAARPAASVLPALGCVVLFLLPFAAGGTFAAVMAVREARSGDWSQAGFLTTFALVFGGVGFGGIAAVIAGRGRAEEALAREARNPDSPWLWRDDWASRQITDTSRTQMWFAWSFAALWNLVSVPSAILGVRAAINEGNRAALVALLFPLVGAGLLIWAVRSTLRYRRYGVSRFELATLPAAVGHALEGTVRTPAGLRPAEGFKVVLSCIRRVTTGSGRGRSTSESVLWQDERRVVASGVGVPVAFAIPPDAAPCDATRSSDRTLWRLVVSAEVPGVDYAATFEVPVFRTAASDRPRTEEELAVAAQSAVPADYRQPAGSRIQVSTTRRGTEIFYPRARNLGMSAGLTVFLALWTGAVWGTVALHAPLIFPLVFGGFGLLLAFLTLDQWLRVTRVTAGDGTVTVASGWLSPGGERTLRAAEIADVTIKIGAQAGGTPFYDIVIVTTAGKRVGAGGGVRDTREAEWLAGTIRRAVQPELGSR